MSTYQRNSGNPFQELLQHASQLDSPLHQALEYPKSEARKEFFSDIADQLTKRFGKGPLTPNRKRYGNLERRAQTQPRPLMRLEVLPLWNP
jgi:hypothetical protein